MTILIPRKIRVIQIFETQYFKLAALLRGERAHCIEEYVRRWWRWARSGVAGRIDSLGFVPQPNRQGCTRSEQEPINR